MEHVTNEVDEAGTGWEEVEAEDEEVEEDDDDDDGGDDNTVVLLVVVVVVEEGIVLGVECREEEKEVTFVVANEEACELVVHESPFFLMRGRETFE